MRAGIFFLEIVAIVGAGQRNVQFLVDFEQAAIRDSLMIEPVGLHFKIEMFLPEDFLKFAGHRHGAGHIFLADQIGNLAAQAA